MRIKAPKSFRNWSRESPLWGDSSPKSGTFWYFAAAFPPPVAVEVAQLSGPRWPSAMPSLTWIGATSRPSGAKNLIFGLWVNLPLRGILPVKNNNNKHAMNCLEQPLAWMTMLVCVRILGTDIDHLSVYGWLLYVSLLYIKKHIPLLLVKLCQEHQVSSVSIFVKKCEYVRCHICEWESVFCIMSIS